MGSIIGLVVVVLIFLILLFAPGRSGENNEDYSLATHASSGSYRVLYTDGYLSQPFMRKTANFYAKHFGGRVVPRNYSGPHRVRGGEWVTGKPA